MYTSIPHGDQRNKRDDVFYKVQSVLDNVQIRGKGLTSSCPLCGGDDRFFSGPKFDYNVWHCRQCQHTTSTSALLGLAFVVEPRPAVKPWNAPTQNQDVLDAVRRLYGSLADFAVWTLSRTDHAQQYLLDRGLDRDFSRLAGLGYLDGKTYRDWYGHLTPNELEAVPLAGLPDGSQSRLYGHASMFAAGYKGKIVLPYHDDDGLVVDLRTRSISPKDTVRGDQVRYTSPKGGQADRGALVPFGLQLDTGTQRVVLTEGEFKSLVPLAAGLPWPVLALRGTSDRVQDMLDAFRGRLVVLAFDNDTKRDQDGLTAGQRATINVGRLLRSQGVDVAVLDPVQLGDQKGLDDFVNAYGVDALTDRVRPGKTLTLPEYEDQLSLAGSDLSRFTMPRPDPGTVRRWTPGDHVDELRHMDRETITLNEAVQQIEDRTRSHWETWRKGRSQLLVTAGAGVGKTTTTVQTALEHAKKNELTVAVVLPNHDTIDEKITDGTLAGFQHIYGRRWDEDEDGIPNQDRVPVQNCEQAETATLLMKKGYRPGAILCPTCPALLWCQTRGYKAQFVGKQNRAYVHAHLFSDYPEAEDLVVVDELTHKNFIDGQSVWVGDIVNALGSHAIKGSQRGLLDALVRIFSTPGLGDTEGAELYEVLEREFPQLRDVDAWGDGSLVQGALDALAKSFTGQDDRSVYEADELPDQFGEKLFAILSDDVRRLNAGQSPTGRLRLVVPEDPKKSRRLVMVYSRGSFPAWFVKRPTVILNATADEDVLDQLVGPLDVLNPAVAIMDGNQVVQDVTRNNAKSGLLGTSDDAQRRRRSWLDQVRDHITDEADTTIITTKALETFVQEAFPLAKTAYYGNLEGKNDLQSGTTILANSPPVNLAAVQWEAMALWPGVDVTLGRSVVAFGEQNAMGEYLAVEQVDAVDPKVRSLLWQHRDAMVVQAVHRSRLVRESGRKVVVLFARPVPGLRPTMVLKDRQRTTTARDRTQKTVQKLLDASQALVQTQGGYTLSQLAEQSGTDRKTARKYWETVTSSGKLNWFDLPALQPLQNGGTKRVDLRFALPQNTVENARLHDWDERYKNILISIVPVVQPWVPDGWTLDLPAPAKPTISAPPAPEPTPEIPQVDVQSDDLDVVVPLLDRVVNGQTLTMVEVQLVMGIVNAYKLRTWVDAVAYTPNSNGSFGTSAWSVRNADQLLDLVLATKTDLALVLA